MATTSNIPPAILSGARIKVGFTNGDASGFIGIYNNVTISVGYDIMPVYILGAYAPAALQYTGAQPIQIRASGYRALDHGPYVSGQMPKLQALMNTPYLTFTLIDRESGRKIGIIEDIYCGGFDSAVTAKQLEEMTLSYVGRFYSDESSEADGGALQHEPAGLEAPSEILATT